MAYILDNACEMIKDACVDAPWRVRYCLIGNTESTENKHCPQKTTVQGLRKR